MHEAETLHVRSGAGILRRRGGCDVRSAMPEYITVGMTLRTTRNRNEWDSPASVRNLFNADAREPGLAPGTSIPCDLPMPGRFWCPQAVYAL
jgi:hypothetical protein